MSREAEVERTTKETAVHVSLAVDGSGRASAETGIPFFDHMLEQLGRHARFDLEIEANGDLGPFRTLQKQAAWRGRPTDQQLRRFMGSGGSRKARYARILVDALDPERVPPPLAGALAHV